LLSSSSSALGFGRQTLDRTFFLFSTHLSTSSCCSSWRRCWTLLFWDLVKPSGHHCGLGFLCVWLDHSSSSCNLCRRSGAWHMILVVWTSLGPLPRWVPGPTTHWATGTTRLALHGTWWREAQGLQRRSTRLGSCTCPALYGGLLDVPD
jgi:hypothetical protein